MRPSVRLSITSSFIHAVWALITLVLFFMVLLLIYEMMESGQKPLSTITSLNPKANTEPQQPVETVFRPTTITGECEPLLYYANDTATALSPHKIKMERSDSAVENCRNALKHLVMAPPSGLTPVLPEDTTIRAIYLLNDGELVVDFGQQLATQQSRTQSVSVETLMLYGVVNTLTQDVLYTPNDPPVRKVRFLFNGEEPNESFPAHLDISEPILPNMDWVVADESWSIND